jgi:hypothetical protein
MSRGTSQLCNARDKPASHGHAAVPYQANKVIPPSGSGLILGYSLVTFHSPTINNPLNSAFFHDHQVREGQAMIQFIRLFTDEPTNALD